MPFLHLFGGQVHEGLPPSFRPSMVMPSVANATATIPSVGEASMAGRACVNTSQAVGSALSRLSSSRDMAPIRIACRDWTDGEIFDWYRRQPHTTISKLELRKERDQFKHEYIVIYLENGWYHRIERRPIHRNVEAVSEKGCEAEDSLTPVSDADLAVIRSETDAEFILEFKSNKPDLYNVIAVAVAIHLDDQTKNYTLQQYNCYFVARSIIALVTRLCIFQAPVMAGLRWDRVTESAIFNVIFGGDWNKLATVMKASISVVLESLLWNVIKEDAETRIEKEEDWDRLRVISRRVIHEEVERSSKALAIDVVQRAVNEWIIDATQMTLWHENLDQNLSDWQYAIRSETSAKGALRAALELELDVHLPGNMLKELSKLLPERLIDRIPPTALAHLTPEILARISVTVLEKAPGDLQARLPQDVLVKAPAELWQRISVNVFSKAKDPVLLTLPDDLSIVPQKLLEVSLQRMRHLLDQPKDHPDRALALKFLRRLPQEQLTQLPPSYIAMRDSEPYEELDTSADNQTREEETPDDSVEIKPQIPFLGLGPMKRMWDETSFIGLLILLIPVPVLKHIPPLVMDILPNSSLVLLPTSALERLPNELLAKLKSRHFERLPLQLLLKIPASLLARVPRATLERLPTSLMERVPPELVQKLPVEFFENLPEDLTDQIRKVIQSSTFENDELKQELLERVKAMLRETLFMSSGTLPATLIQVSVLTNELKRTSKTLLKHEDLQKHILNMNRIHSKRVSQVPLLGMAEEKVYDGLRTKAEKIWQVMRLHPSLQGQSR